MTDIYELDIVVEVKDGDVDLHPILDVIRPKWKKDDIQKEVNPCVKLR